MRAGIDGVAHDIMSVMRPWGFEVEEVCCPVELWHGEEDRAMPVDAARKLAADLPDCRARIEPGLGACVIAHKWDEILDTLAA